MGSVLIGEVTKSLSIALISNRFMNFGSPKGRNVCEKTQNNLWRQRWRQHSNGCRVITLVYSAPYGVKRTLVHRGERALSGERLASGVGDNWFAPGRPVG
ncbi:hypothetical protein RRG08_043052 [Elysia crispata]|uniref:Uncharacterized protein n=1 Tax=Elysia crispata TaxID=231223 RepID=A0AAE1CP59_9GAST|nr:hypothetical protein RRG08_043052 [Elysia crispata]